MRFEAWYRASLYLLLFLSSLVLNMDADVDYAAFYPPGMAIACVIAFLTVDRNPKWGLDTTTANLLAIASLFVVYFEYRMDPTQVVLACGHWLFYLVLVKMFRPKAPTDDWYLIVLSLMQVLVGSFLSQSDRVGMTLISWAILAIWVLSLFYLHRKAIQVQQDSSAGELSDRGVASIDQASPYKGLFSLAFFLSTSRAILTTLVLGLVIFLFLPRSPGRMQAPRSNSSPRSVTGFDDEVDLGDVSLILENNEVVMTIELLNDEGELLEDTEREFLWRGVALTRYENQSWKRGASEISLVEPPDVVVPEGLETITQKIILKPLSKRVVFALRPVFKMRGDLNSRIRFNSSEGTFVFNPSGGNRLFANMPFNNRDIHYTVVSVDVKDQIHLQPDEFLTRPYGQNSDLVDLPPELKQRLTQISDRIVEGIPEEQVLERARAIESYLRDSGEFHYTLQQKRADAGVDPVLDFLENTKEGHCEYFASSLVLLLRSQGIPARMVNGFKGGDWNSRLNFLVVRQKHAHSWVEALIREPQRGWVTLDATPAAERAAVVAQVSRVPRFLQDFIDAGRRIWSIYFAGFDSSRQQALYEPIRRLFRNARAGFGIMREAIVRTLRWVFDFPNLSAFFSIRGFLVSITTMILGFALFRLLRFLIVRLRRYFQGPSENSTELSGALAAYVRLLKLLKSQGLQRSSNETPREFARRASILLIDHGSGDDGVPLSKIPGRIVEAFYRVRFGALPLSDQSAGQLDAELDALESRLQAASS